MATCRFAQHIRVVVMGSCPTCAAGERFHELTDSELHIECETGKLIVPVETLVCSECKMVLEAEVQPY